MFLAARDEQALTWLAEDAADAGHAHTRFREPDLDDALTAVALEPAAHRLVRKLPLALTGLGAASRPDLITQP